MPKTPKSIDDFGKLLESKKYSNFYKTVTQSPQWKAWQEEQNERLRRVVRTGAKVATGCYDMSEVMECGWISQEHFQEFLKFCKGIK